MIKVAVIGGNGYTGLELLRLLAKHPYVDIAHVTSRSYAGQVIGQAFPQLVDLGDLAFENLDLDKVQAADLAFLCLPHGHAMTIVGQIDLEHTRVIDLGADFRLKDPASYESYYQQVAPPSSLLDEAVYGLADIYPEVIQEARLVANPGCFVTSVLLGLYPALESGFIESQEIMISSASGISGAGRNESLDNLYAEMTENFKAYKPLTHRHVPEMEAELGRFAKEEVKVEFVPHLLPIARGIQSTIFTRLKAAIDLETIHQHYQDSYQDSPFVQVLPLGTLPQVKQVRGTNRCQIGLAQDPQTGRLIIFSALDNLMKGASGQAVQNMNLLFGWPANLALDQLTLWP
ncbi:MULTISPECIES: N-acetyl-gamma-glutamyl-phosphate reductase [Aerococcus]|uniref:N-acetyl-gamma-glutamyl-phosphate reductase n=1 Tax=Aerococcus sanguinicola TaxID=119206 RepID=A0A5N1GLZ0_9LACT|nr:MULTISPECIES: N-acetyl-gamma-glutamyl-phosphate reductase [Aerococcus]KAA9301802.1 N-acetyl-gamma-glutamyl-phosphate reductase [Aerococcus sanguinicola]MDK6368778.1 N-acetyl-gamma-glutamyl-phosphate reductase [Aerococcus sp. UMB9870]MDK6679326.1 N-acetyl-gamma-glutamyl-phosphate reductase [Aerococcus sp. UMB8608]MDK6685832.1 N-acetyl-gamma-glutamyl-phosphate reductase [Aerococcus sp. UMB8623]MDK6939401.1 N-acetyl-gamma-glutamyl-phosphate reductase [Aerococcus sp. UMB8487]